MPLMESPICNLQRAGAYIKLAAKIQAVPFTWIGIITETTRVNTHQTPLTSLTKLRLPFWYLITCYTLIYWGYLWIDFIYHLRVYEDQKEYVPLIIHAIWCCGTSILTFMRVHHFRRHKDIVYAFNQLIQLVRRFSRKSSARECPEMEIQYQRRWALFDLLLGLTRHVVIGGSFCYAILVLVFPNYRIYWYLMILPTQWSSNWAVKAGLFLLEYGFMMSSWMAFNTSTFLMFLYVITIGNSLEVLNRKEAGHADNIESQSCKLKRAKAYQMLHILNTLFDISFGDWFGLPSLTLMGTCVTLLIYAVVILMPGLLSPFLIAFLLSAGTTGILACVVILPIASNVLEKSCRFKADYIYPSSFIGGKATLLGSKVMASCKPLGIQVGRFYIIRKLTTLTYFSLFLGNLVNVLVGFKSYS